MGVVVDPHRVRADAVRGLWTQQQGNGHPLEVVVADLHSQAALLQGRLRESYAEVSALRELLRRKGVCAEEVEAFERRSGARFDVVVHLRPDIAVLAPFSPYWSFRCLNNTIYSSKKDYIYFSARDALVAVIRRMSADYQGCVGSSWWSDRACTVRITPS